MLGWLIGIRDFFLTLTLAWVGISLAQPNPVALEEIDKIQPALEASATRNCLLSRRH
jgi:hypothetical protein